jgi:predicted  nucleic acid-binding Zn-ribbon protein
VAVAQDAVADRDAKLKRMEEQIKAMEDRVVRETARANKATADLKTSAQKQIANVNGILKNKNDVIDKLRKELECATEMYRHQRKDFDAFRGPPKGPRQRLSDATASNVQRFYQRVPSKDIDSPSFEMRKPRVEKVKTLVSGRTSQVMQY